MELKKILDENKGNYPIKIRRKIYTNDYYVVFDGYFWTSKSGNAISYNSYKRIVQELKGDVLSDDWELVPDPTVWMLGSYDDKQLGNINLIRFHGKGSPKDRDILMIEDKKFILKECK